MSNNWLRICITDVCTSITDCVNRTAPTVEKATPYKMLRTTNVKDGRIDTESVKYVTEETYRVWTRREIPRKGDVILTREAPLGDVGILRDNDTVFMGQRLVSYRADPSQLEPWYLLYALMSDELQGQIKAFGSGSTVEHMRVPDAKKLLLPLPPLPTQRRIAAILSAYDDLIENNQRRIAILEEMARSLYREWFVEFRFPGHEGVEIVERDGVRAPEGWQVSPLGKLAYDVRRGVNPEDIDPATPYVGLEHLPRRSITLSDWGKAREVQSTKLRFKKGEILFKGSGKS